jgi:hypothetical protein
MPQHVGMDSERHLGGRPEPRNHPAKGNGGPGSAALAHEDIPSGFLFALETAQGAKLDAGQWMDGRDPILKSIDVQAAMDEIGLLQRNEHNSDARKPCRNAIKIMVALMPMPIVSGRLHEPFDLALGEVLASAIFGIRQPTRRDCSLYSAWSAGAQS